MNRHILILGGLGAVAMAIWAYNVNYRTMTRFDRLNDLRTDIAIEREAIRVLKVEWAWLNNPDRLSALVKRYRKELALVPIPGDAFQKVDKIPFPPVPAKPVPVNAEPAEAGPVDAQATNPSATNPSANTAKPAKPLPERADAAPAPKSGVASRPGIPVPTPRPTVRSPG